MLGNIIIFFTHKNWACVWPWEKEGGKLGNIYNMERLIQEESAKKNKKLGDWKTGAEGENTRKKVSLT